MDLNEKAKVILCVENFKLFLSEPVTNYHEFQKMFEKIPILIRDLVNSSELFCNKNTFSKDQKFSIIVHLMQYVSSYELFKNVRTCRSSEKHAISEIRRCVSKQLMLLLNTTISLLETEDGHDATVGSFLSLMDMALDKIAEVAIKKDLGSVQHELNSISSIVEEILCLSMSIAQIAFDDDNKIITAGCCSVLNSIESLKTEVTSESPNIAMCNLAIDTCTDTLCAFETRVNTAVLRLCLKVFSQYQTPITNLYDYCEKSDNPDEEICLFSIASSVKGQSVADIKNAMSNLEFLEGELVPEFIAMSKRSTSDATTFAKILKKSWCSQIKCIRKAIHDVIEPSAYCKLVYEELKQKSEEMWQEISESKTVTISQVELFSSYTKELGKMFKACMESFESGLVDGVKNQLEIVHEVLYELEAFKTLLLKVHSIISPELNHRIFKRCQVLSLTIKRLWLSTLSENHENHTTFDAKTDDVEECSRTKADTFIIPNENEKNSVLESIINKSRKIIKDRTICHLNQNCTFTKTLETNTTKTTIDRPSNASVRVNNLRNCSYRRSVKCLDDFQSILKLKL